MTKPGSILIVDDEPAVASMLREHLTLRGYKVDVAENAGDAVMLASLDRPDAVVLDLMLPEISGERIFVGLRELDESIPIVLLSGMVDDGVARRLLAAGAFDYLRKPANLERLFATLALAVAAGRDRPRAGA